MDLADTWLNSNAKDLDCNSVLLPANLGSASSLYLTWPPGPPSFWSSLDEKSPRLLPLTVCILLRMGQTQERHTTLGYQMHMVDRCRE